MTRPVKGSQLKSWAAKIASRAGMKKAKVAWARKLALVIHGILCDGTCFEHKSWPQRDLYQLRAVVGHIGFGREDHRARWQGPVAGTHEPGQAGKTGAALRVTARF